MIGSVSCRAAGLSRVWATALLFLAILGSCWRLPASTSPVVGDRIFVYVVTGWPVQSLRGFRMRPDGQLVPLGTATPIMDKAVIVVEPGGRFLYAWYIVKTKMHYQVLPNGFRVGNREEWGKVAQFRIERTGLLSPLRPPIIPAGHGALSVTVDPRGRFVYSVDMNATALLRSRLTPGGQLSTPIPAGKPGQPRAFDVNIDPTGRFAYVFGDQGGDYLVPTTGLSQYRITPSGALLPLNPPGVGADPFALKLIFGPGGHYAYVLSPQGITAYPIHADGPLGYSDKLIFTLYSDSDAQSYVTPEIAFAPAGKYAYVGDVRHRVLWSFRVEEDGTFYPLHHYYVQKSGELTELHSAERPGGGALKTPEEEGIGQIIIEPGGQYAYVMGGDDRVGRILQYQLGKDGGIAPLKPGWVVVGRQAPRIILAHTGGVPLQRGKPGASGHR